MNCPAIFFIIGLLLGGLLISEYDLRAENKELKELVIGISKEYQVNVNLIFAMIYRESAWDKDAISKKGAIGLMQIMPATGWVECGLTKKQLFDPRLNVNCGVSYLVKLLRQFGSLRLALCAYNAGRTRVAQLGRCPRIKETIEYSRNILNVLGG